VFPLLLLFEKIGEIPQLAARAQCLPNNVHNAQDWEDGQVAC